METNTRVAILHSKRVERLCVQVWYDNSERAWRGTVLHNDKRFNGYCLTPSTFENVIKNAKTRLSYVEDTILNEIKRKEEIDRQYADLQDEGWELKYIKED